MLRPFCAALAILAVLLAAPAFAQDDEEEQGEDEAATESEADEPEEVDYNRTGLYLGLAGTWGVEEFNDTNDINVDDAVGLNARVGYRVLPWLSGEVQGEFVPGFQLDFGATDSDVDIWLAGVNLRWNLPTGVIQPYLLTGGGYMGADMSGGGNDETDRDGNGGYARLGGGLELYPWPFLAIDLGLAYVVPTGDVSKLDFLSITWGALYRF